MVREISMFIEVLIGIGFMYGFIKFDINVIGNKVVIMVRVVRMVGLLILFIVGGMSFDNLCLFIVICW